MYDIEDDYAHHDHSNTTFPLDSETRFSSSQYTREICLVLGSIEDDWYMMSYSLKIVLEPNSI